MIPKDQRIQKENCTVTCQPEKSFCYVTLPTLCKMASTNYSSSYHSESNMHKEDEQKQLEVPRLKETPLDSQNIPNQIRLERKTSMLEDILTQTQNKDFKDDDTDYKNLSPSSSIGKALAMDITFELADELEKENIQETSAQDSSDIEMEDKEENDSRSELPHNSHISLIHKSNSKLVTPAKQLHPHQK